MSDESTVGDDRAFWTARRAARVELVDVVVPGHRTVGGRIRLTGEPGMIVDPGCRGAGSDPHAALDRAEIALDRVDGAGVLPGGDEEPGLRVVDHEGPLCRRQAKVQRDGYDAGPGGREVQQDVLDAVPRQECDAIADAEAGPDERVREPVALDEGLSIRDPSPSMGRELAVRTLASLIVERIVQSHRDRRPPWAILPPVINRGRTGSDEEASAPRREPGGADSPARSLEATVRGSPGC
jgi:hypothetical protein